MRALSLRIAQSVEAIAMPRTFFDGERAVRAITLADRMLVRLPDPQHEGGLSPARQRLRVFADQVLAVIEGLSSPATFRDAERAARCVLAADSLLTQLYAPPKQAKRTRAEAYGTPAGDDQAEPEDSPEIAAVMLFDTLDKTALAYAREVGFYPDGAACDPAAVEPHRLACPEELDILEQWMDATNGKPGLGNESLLPLARIMAARANGSLRAQARHLGHWPGGKPFHDTDAQFFVLSKRFETEVLKRPGPGYGDVDEEPAHDLFPWWLVKNPDTG